MFKKIDATAIPGNFAERISKQWALVTAGTPEACNSMTVSWGGFGFIWNAPVSTIYIRPQRYTKPLIDENEFYTVSFLPEQYRKELTYMGRHSGADGDKFAATGLTVAYADCGAPYIAEAELVLVCRKQFCQPMLEDSFVDPEVVSACYPEKDFHYLYIGKIVEALERV